MVARVIDGPDSFAGEFIDASVSIRTCYYSWRDEPVRAELGGQLRVRVAADAGGTDGLS
jgi:hypothetical protein